MKAVAAVRVGLLVVWTLSVITGCANQSKPAIAEPEIQAGRSEMTEAGDGEEIQSLQERSLVLLFRGLLLMDDKPELRIQKTQAESMLPLVRKSVDSGLLNAEEKKQIVNLLTKPQMDFLGDTRTRLRRSDPEAGQDADPMLPEKESGKDTVASSQQTDGSLDEEDWPGSEESVEQRLLDRLTSRLQ